MQLSLVMACAIFDLGLSLWTPASVNGVKQQYLQ